MHAHYELSEYEVWQTTVAGKNSLRLTTDLLLPFDGGALLKASLLPQGLMLFDREQGLRLLLTPGLEGAALQLFQDCLKKGIPLILSEVRFPANEDRNWIVQATASLSIDNSSQN